MVAMGGVEQGWMGAVTGLSCPAWGAELLERIIGQRQAETTFDLAFDAEGTPFLALVEAGRFGNVVKAGYWDGKQWVLVSLNSDSGSYAERPRLTVDSGGVVGLCWEEASPAGRPLTRMLRFDAGEWVHVH